MDNAELRKWCDAATPGPWASVDDGDGYFAVETADGKWNIIGELGTPAHKNTCLIAAMRNELKRLLDDSDELARLKGMAPLRLVGHAEAANLRIGPLLTGAVTPVIDDARTFLRELLKDVETQRDIARGEALKWGQGARMEPEACHWSARTHLAAYVAERIRYFLETPAKEPEK